MPKRMYYLNFSGSGRSNTPESPVNTIIIYNNYYYFMNPAIFVTP